MIKDLDLNALEAFFEATPIRMTFVDVDNIIRAMNTQAWSRVGVKVEERLGTSILDCHSPESASKVTSVIDRLKSGREKAIKTLFRTKNSKKVYREIYTAIRDKDGTYLGTLHVMYDISEGAQFKKDSEASAT
ncbi:MAG: PAS domain-containing protein [Deltaproteobacteria bacterium]|nr:PAS domain-containing protein [Deltaproteobacteria bacterium]MBW1816105.1 PAS domain-containing protein [Deltaproteobacteria bacterium]